MAYTYLPVEVKSISKAEFEGVKNAYIEAEKNKQEWIMQALQKVFDDVKLGIVKVSEQ